MTVVRLVGPSLTMAMIGGAPEAVVKSPIYGPSLGYTADMRRWQLSIPLVVFAAILVVAFLSPRYVGLHCPSFAAECSDLAILHLTKAPSRFLSIYLPEGIGAAALVLLAAAVPPERVGRGMVLIAGTLVLAGTLAAVYLPGAIVPDPLRCGFIPAGDRFAGLIGCGVEGGHADPRFALRYLVLFNGLILLSDYVRRRHVGWHRRLGRVQVVVLLLFVLPSSVVMSRHAFGGWPAGLSFTSVEGNWDRYRLPSGSTTTLGDDTWKPVANEPSAWPSRVKLRRVLAPESSA